MKIIADIKILVWAYIQPFLMLHKLYRLSLKRFYMLFSNADSVFFCIRKCWILGKDTTPIACLSRHYLYERTRVCGRFNGSRYSEKIGNSTIIESVRRLISYHLT